MGKECPNHIKQFDAFFSTRQLKMMKLFLPYIAPALRRKLIVYIKYKEWQVTVQYLSRPPLFSESEEAPPNIFLSEKTEELSMEKLCCLLEPYLDEKGKNNLKQFKEMQENMEMFQQMQEMMGTMGGMEQDMDSLNSILQMFEGMGNQKPPEP